MELYNFIVGGVFPPRMPSGFNKVLFGNVDVVLFVFSEEREGRSLGMNLAHRLRTNRGLRGLVYAYEPENRDFMIAADFFRVPTFPSVALVGYDTFLSALCVDGHRPSKTTLDYAVVHENTMRLEQPVQAILDCVHNFHSGALLKSRGVSNCFARLDQIKESHLQRGHRRGSVADYDTEILALFSRPAPRHTSFEKMLYDAALEFGAMTDNVLVRILYPTYMSDAYQKTLHTYQVTQLPALIFRKTATDPVTINVERPFFESLPNLQESLHFMISDLHQVTATYGIDDARQRFEQFVQKLDQTPVVENHALGRETVITIKEMHGDIVLKDKYVTDAPSSGMSR